MKLLATTISIIAGTIAIIAFILQITKRNPIIEIKTIAIDRLTDPPSIEGLQAEYKFKDSTVKSLWKLDYFISNIGDETIIGEGNKKNIIKDFITFGLPNGFKLLEIKSPTQNFPFEITNDYNKVNIKFLQWRPKEYFELVLYTEQLDENEQLLLQTNEREIIDGRIKYTLLQKDLTGRVTAFDILPRFLREPLRWLGLVIFGSMLLILPIALLSEGIKILKYKRWSKFGLPEFEEWVKKQVKERIFDKSYTPANLPANYWIDYPSKKPPIPSGEFGSLVVGVIFLIILSAIPFLTLIRI